ncbi:hypothetical protein [Nocardioides korecus]
MSILVLDVSARAGYRRTWSVVATAMGAVGAAGAALTMAPVVVVATAGSTWLVVQFLAGTTVWAEGRSPLPTVLPSLAVGGLVPVLPGAVALLGPSAAVLWVVLALTAPPVVAWGVRSLDRPAVPGTPVAPSTAGATSPPGQAGLAGQAAPPTTSVVDADTPTRELVRLWSTSTRELATHPGPVRTAVLVGVRAAVLDALQRRDPRGFEAWLAHDPTRTSPRAHLRR